MTHTLDTILCGVDDSGPGRTAVQVAVPLAHAAGADLVLAHVTGIAPAAMPLTATPEAALALPPSSLARETLATELEAELHAARWLAEVAEQAGAREAEQLIVTFGDPANRLAAVAGARGAGLIVVGSRGRSAVRDALLGSVSGRLAADAPVPVLAVGPSVTGSLIPETWEGRTIVCGFDGSESAVRASHAAAALAARVGARLRIVCVLDGAAESPAPELPHEEGLQAAAGAPLEIERERRRGDPAEQLERVAVAATAPAIVVGTRGRAPWRAALLGSVSRKVLDLARRPVVLVPPGVGR